MANYGRPAFDKFKLIQKESHVSHTIKKASRETHARTKPNMYLLPQLIEEARNNTRARTKPAGKGLQLIDNLP